MAMALVPVLVLVSEDVASLPVVPKLRRSRPQLLLERDERRSYALALRLSLSEEPQYLAVVVDRLVESAVVAFHDVVHEGLDSFLPFSQVAERLRRVERPQDFNHVRERVEATLVLELLRQVLQLPLHLPPVHCPPDIPRQSRSSISEI